LWPQRAQHGLVVEASIALRHDHHFAAAMVEHERQFALAKDRHEWIEHRTDARAREIKQRELPAIRQLHRDHVALYHTEPREAHGNPVRHARHLRVREACGLSVFDSYRRERDLRCAFGHAGVQLVVDGAPGPPAPCLLPRAARPDQYRVELHVRPPVALQETSQAARITPAPRRGPRSSAR